MQLESQSDCLLSSLSQHSPNLLHISFGARCKSCRRRYRSASRSADNQRRDDSFCLNLTHQNEGTAAAGGGTAAEEFDSGRGWLWKWATVSAAADLRGGETNSLTYSTVCGCHGDQANQHTESWQGKQLTGSDAETQFFITFLLLRRAMGHTLIKTKCSSCFYKRICWYNRFLYHNWFVAHLGAVRNKQTSK